MHVTLAPVAVVDVKAGDVVLTRWKGNHLLHLVIEADGERLVLGNNLGKTNGWVDRGDVQGIVVDVDSPGGATDGS